MSSDTWAGVLAGAAISIPVSIGAALVVPRIQTWIDKRGEASHAKMRERIKSEYDEVLRYALNSDLLIGRMLVGVIQILLVIFAVLVYQWVHPEFDTLLTAVVHPTRPNLSEHTRTVIAASLSSLVLALTTVWTVIIIRTTWKFVSLFSNVRFFKIYVKSVPDDIRDKQFEDVITYAIRERTMPTAALRRLFKDMKAEEAKSQSTPSIPPPDSTAHK